MYRSLVGSALAVGKALAAILENHQNEDGSIAVPIVQRQIGAEFAVAGGFVLFEILLI